MFNVKIHMFAQPQVHFQLLYEAKERFQHKKLRLAYRQFE